MYKIFLIFTLAAALAFAETPSTPKQDPSTAPAAPGTSKSPTAKSQEVMPELPGKCFQEKTCKDKNSCVSYVHSQETLEPDNVVYVVYENINKKNLSSASIFDYYEKNTLVPCPKDFAPAKPSVKAIDKQVKKLNEDEDYNEQVAQAEKHFCVQRCQIAANKIQRTPQSVDYIQTQLSLRDWAKTCVNRCESKYKKP